jgi:hypothetical protein
VCSAWVVVAQRVPHYMSHEDRRNIAGCRVLMVSIHVGLAGSSAWVGSVALGICVHLGSNERYSLCGGEGRAVPWYAPRDS